jgi:aminopeptidase YwaD
LLVLKSKLASVRRFPVKKLLFITLIIIAITLLNAQNSHRYLIRLDRSAASAYYQVNDPAGLLRALPAGIKVFHASKNFLLAEVDETLLKQLPSAAYQLLDEFPLQDNWYLLTSLKGIDQPVTPALGTEIVQMDEIIVLRTPLSDWQISKFTKLPWVRLDFQPLQLNNARLKAPEPTRVDFGSLLSLVNADSVAWFLQHLQDFGTRNAQADNRYDVAMWIRNQFARFGISNAQVVGFDLPQYEQYGFNNQYNVVATIPGTLAPDKYIIVGGHHDSIVYDGNNPLITAPGADDNASGTVAALEMARVMQACNYQPECSIRFVTFACEEYGLWGSHYQADQADLLNQNIKLMINHDMIATSTLPSSQWYVCLEAYEGSVSQEILAANVIDAQTLLTPYFVGWNSASSDSYSYWQNGFPVVYFSEDEFSPYYHTINDLTSHTSAQYCAEVIKASTAVCATFDQIPSTVSFVQVADTGTGNTIFINWGTDNLESDVLNYKIYVSSEAVPDPVEYIAGVNSFTVGNLTSGTEYSIGVAAVDSDGNEGLAYNISCTPQLVPQTPAGIADFPQLHAVSLTWLPNTELDLAGYKLYRSTSENGVYTPMFGNNVITTAGFWDGTVADLVYYYYKLTAIDDLGNESPPTEPIRSRAMTLNQGILIVDETKNNSSNTVFSPNDAVSDAFYEDVLHSFAHAQYDTETQDTLKLADIGIYSSLLWHGNDSANLAYPLAVRNEIMNYIINGGKVFVTSYYPSRAFDNNNNYPYTFANGNFLFDNFGIQDVAYFNSARFRYALPETSGYPPLTVDSLKTVPPLLGHIYNIESISANSVSSDIYYYGSDYANTVPQGVMNGTAVGVYKDQGNGRSVVLSFPLFNMKQPDVTNLMYHVFHNVFGEIVANTDDNLAPVAGLSIGNCYPNPFSSYISLEVRGSKLANPLRVSIFNIKGQMIKTLFNSPAKAELQSLAWNGTDDAGRQVGSGLYLVKAEQDGKTATQKLIKLR